MLKILAIIYDLLTTIRNYLFNIGIIKVYHSYIPVISVGNISLGGNGKTPLVKYIYQNAVNNGFSPVVIMRGYGGKLSGPVEVKDHSVAEVGDEAKMLQAQGVKVLIARSRVAGAKYIEKFKIGNLIILDDGFQHRYLARDLNIISVDVSSENAISDFKKAELLPLGRFRESLKAALPRIDLIVWSPRGGNVNYQELKAGIDPRIKQFESRLSNLSLKPECSSQVKDFVAFCGLANPEGFFSSVKSLLPNTEVFIAKPDHFAFNLEWFESLRNGYPEYAFVCTAKDAVKLANAEGLYILDFDYQIVPTEFFDQVLAKIDKKNKKLY